MLRRTAVLTTVLCACTAPVEDAPLPRGGVPEPIGTTQSALTVEQAVTAGCSTSQVEALSLQIIAQGACNEPDAFVELVATSNVVFGGAVLPYLEEPARAALTDALEDNPGTSMTVNSMLRTVAQQYLLYRWYQTGTCGIGLAATPGNSNHETGLAIDISQYNTWKPILDDYGFSWLGSNDPVHFDYEGAGAVDYKGLDILGFQQLWNLNHPSDPIAEDGAYGPQTEGKLKAAPAEGFATGPDCGDPEAPDLQMTLVLEGATDQFSDGPSEGVPDLLEGDAAELVATVVNTGGADAPDAMLALTLPEPFVSASEYRIGDGDPQALDGPIALGTIAAGASVTVKVTVEATGYSVESSEVAMVSASVDADVSSLGLDVYSPSRWEWSGERREGWSSQGGSVSLVDGALSVAAGADEVVISSPALDLTLTDSLGVVLRASRSGGQSPMLAYVTDEEHQVELDFLPDDGAMHDVELAAADLPGWTGVLSELRIVWQAEDGAELALDRLAIETTSAGSGAGGSEPFVAEDLGDDQLSACGCRHAGRDSGAPLYLLLLLFALRRRQGSAGSTPSSFSR